VAISDLFVARALHAARDFVRIRMQSRIEYLNSMAHYVFWVAGESKKTAYLQINVLLFVVPFLSPQLL